MKGWKRISLHEKQDNEDVNKLEKAAILTAVTLLFLPVLISFSSLYPEFAEVSKLTSDDYKCDGVAYEFSGKNVTSQLFVKNVKDSNPFNNEVSKAELLQYWGIDHLEKLGALPAEFTTFTVAFPEQSRVFIKQYIVEQRVKFKNDKSYILCDLGVQSDFFLLRNGRMLPK